MFRITQKLCTIQPNVWTLAKHISCSTRIYAKFKKGQLWRRKKIGDRTSKLTMLPDWSFGDGEPAPLGLAMNQSNEQDKQICRRIIMLLKEMEEAKQICPEFREVTKQEVKELSDHTSRR